MAADGLPPDLAGALAACLDRAAGQPGAAAIWRVWADAVGQQIARRAQPVRLRGTTLVVAVASAPWMQELQLLKPTVLAALHARLPRALVRDLYFTLTELGDHSTSAPTRAARPAAPPRRCDPAPRTQLPDALPEALRQSFGAVLAAWRRRADA